MHCNPITKLLIYLVISVFAVVMSTSVFAGGSFSISRNNDSEPEQHQVKHKHKHKKGGPPAHAPAHGYRAKHQYRYYPCSKVYHDTRRGLYFYLKGDNWEVGASLPSKLQAGLGSYVNLELDTDTPFLYHKQHIKQFPRTDSKKSKNNLWSKVIFMLFYEHATP